MNKYISSRERKMRAWNKEHKEMLYFSGLNFNLSHGCMEMWPDSGISEKTRWDGDDENFIWTEYCELTNSGNTKLDWWEGDILAVADDEDDSIGVIVKFEGSWSIHWNGNEEPTILDSWHRNNLKKTRNMFTNPPK